MAAYLGCGSDLLESNVGGLSGYVDVAIEWQRNLAVWTSRQLIILLTKTYFHSATYCVNVKMEIAFDAFLSSDSVGSDEYDVDTLLEILLQDDDSGQENKTTDCAGSTGNANELHKHPTGISQPAITGKVFSRKAENARRHRHRKKHEVLAVRKEVAKLTQKRDSLRAKHKLVQPDESIAAAREFATLQRHKRVEAVNMNGQLRRALVMQRHFFTAVRSMVLGSPITNIELNMCNLLHSYTHLGRTAYSRHRDFAELCAQSKADFTLQILLRETEGMDFSGPPSIVTHTVPSIQVDSKIVTTVSAFAFDYLSLKTTFIAAFSG
ncbi:hypothetical protein ON010_g14240 [Phytophthora cinnamomi]|nr:hypothetical protein ON010_g14240 [Phytophthora cinnamomi]